MLGEGYIAREKEHEEGPDGMLRKGWTHRSAGASCVGNAWDACRAIACTHPAGVAPFQASLATTKVRISGMGFENFENIIPGRGSIEGKHKRSRETVPAELSLPRTRAVESVGEQEGPGVVNVVAWRGVGWAGYMKSVSRCRATSSLDSRVNTVCNQNLT
jgi:hypothetical protein